MVLVDTSVWISHLRAGRPALAGLLMAGRVLCHPLVIGELACGNLRKRTEVLGLLKNLPQASVADDEETLLFIETHGLAGVGLGYLDVQLLASTRLSGCRLWTDDGNLRTAAKRLSVDFRSED
jgi:predicted nucleic acid-binding protein